MSAGRHDRAALDPAPGGLLHTAARRRPAPARHRPARRDHQPRLPRPPRGHGPVLRHHGCPARQPCTQCASPADRAIAANRYRPLLAPAGPLPVPVRPLAGEMLASYLRRLAAASHLPVPALMSALPDWLTWRFTSHQLPPHGTGLPLPATASLHRLAALTATPAATIARTLPIFGGGPRGPARATTACRRCAAARGITRPVPVHQAAHEMVCTRHGIWLPPPGLPQLNTSACPEIVTAHYRARALLRRCTPEQLIYAQVQAAELIASGLPGREPSPGWEQRTQFLRRTNPGLNAPAETELIRAARYPGIIALAAQNITTAACDPAPRKMHTDLNVFGQPAAGRTRPLTRGATPGPEGRPRTRGRGQPLPPLVSDADPEDEDGGFRSLVALAPPPVPHVGNLAQGTVTVEQHQLLTIEGIKVKPDHAITDQATSGAGEPWNISDGGPCAFGGQRPPGQDLD